MPFQVQKHFQDADGVFHVELSVQPVPTESGPGILHGVPGPVAVLCSRRTLGALARWSRPVDTDVSYFGSTDGLCTRLRFVPAGQSFRTEYFHGDRCRTDVAAAHRASLQEGDGRRQKALPLFMDESTLGPSEEAMEEAFGASTRRVRSRSSWGRTLSGPSTTPSTR